MLKALTAVDAPIMAALHAASFEKAWPEADMLEHIENDIALGWDTDGGLAGFILIRSVSDQSEILTIAVDKDRRKKGIGQKLLSAAEVATAKAGADIIFLEVAEDNAAAIALYKRAGYESFGRRPAYYKRAGGRVAAKLFRKNLPSVT